MAITVVFVVSPVLTPVEIMQYVDLKISVENWEAKLKNLSEKTCTKCGGVFPATNVLRNEVRIRGK